MKKSDEKLTKTDRINYWWSSDLMERLQYKSKKSFRHLIEEATKIMINIDIPYYDNIQYLDREENGKLVKDFRLSRFACYLVVMLADYRKEEVADAKAKFMQKADQYGIHSNDFFELSRIQMREELADANKWLSSAASRAQVTDFGNFTDAGYKGLYGMDAFQLYKTRSIHDHKSINDYMGPIEQLANLLRVTLTEQRIWNEKITGQEKLENIHQVVGKSIRDLIASNTGKLPEQLPLHHELGDLKKQMKEGYKKMIKPNS